MEDQDQRIEVRYIECGSAKSTQIQDEGVTVYWITVFPEAIATAGVIKIYDGFGIDGKLEWQLETGYGRHCVFHPPIPCDTALFVYNDANIGGYTIAYRPRKWK